MGAPVPNPRTRSLLTLRPTQFQDQSYGSVCRQQSRSLLPRHPVQHPKSRRRRSLPLYGILTRYYFVGTSESCRSTSLQTQIEIARYVVGVHRELLNNEDYKPIDEIRRKLWRQWINGDREGDEYAKVDLPIIALVVADYFGVKQDKPPRTAELERVKWHYVCWKPQIILSHVGAFELK